MPRRAAKDVAPAALPAIKRAFTRWDNRYADLHDDVPRPSLNEMHRVTGINESVLGQYKRGQRRPIIDHCLPLARWYDVPVDDVLAELGYPNLAKLISTTRASNWEEREMILKLLRIAQSNDAWKSADWRTVSWKAMADEQLTNSNDIHQKARNYALIVLGWEQDPERDIPLARKSSDKLEVVS
jgi:transcriptional regulator with XRE-family HTH domain